ncbi:unnamed protein product [Lactuca saligna]|uniref:Uncharacterized protein n=1 Tax=Lactuca saligna TaxID=75948 RepID=A0AA35ZP14_LACSI|nr:unnamed protein product [Lactuca saligna]
MTSQILSVIAIIFSRQQHQRPTPNAPPSIAYFPQRSTIDPLHHHEPPSWSTSFKHVEEANMDSKILFPMVQFSSESQFLVSTILCLFDTKFFFVELEEDAFKPGFHKLDLTPIIMSFDYKKGW